MELKHAKINEAERDLAGLNRTFMELKPVCLIRIGPDLAES